MTTPTETAAVLLLYRTGVHTYDRSCRIDYRWRNRKHGVSHPELLCWYSSTEYTDYTTTCIHFACIYVVQHQGNELLIYEYADAALQTFAPEASVCVPAYACTRIIQMTAASFLVPVF